jgi:hypothetical protein
MMTETTAITGTHRPFLQVEGETATRADSFVSFFLSIVAFRPSRFLWCNTRGTQVGLPVRRLWDGQSRPTDTDTRSQQTECLGELTR